MTKTVTTNLKYLLPKGVKDKLEVEFFKQEKIDEDYADKISIALEIIEQELKQ